MNSRPRTVCGPISRCRRSAHSDPANTAGRGVVRNNRISKVSAPPRIDASIKYSNRLPKPSHSAIAAENLASPPPIQRHAKQTNAAPRTATPAPRCETRTAPLKPPSTATTANPATRMSEMRLAMVMVKRSLAAANAIAAGNSVSPIASLNMTQHRRQNEKAPQRNRSSIPTASNETGLYLSVLERLLNAVLRL